MFTAASFQHLLLDLDYLRQHGVEYDNIEWDEYYEIALTRTSPTTDPIRFTGLEYINENTFSGYTFYVNGVRQGPYVRTYPDGALEIFGHQFAGSSDGTSYEFHRNGNLRMVSMFCRGRRIAKREYDENGTMTSEEYGLAHPEPRHYMDAADGTSM